MTIETQIRETMRAHDSEAPDGTGLRMPALAASPGHRRRALRLAPIGATVAVMVVLALVVATFAHRTTPRHQSRPPVTQSITPAPAPANLQCPKDEALAGSAIEARVPAGPRGVDGRSRLIPLETPTRAIVCGWISPRRPAEKSGAVVLKGNLAGIVYALAWSVPGPINNPTPCSLVLTSLDVDHYLIGLNYPTGTVWVSAPGNHCSGGSNGVFTTSRNLAWPAAEAYRSGQWPARDAPDPCVATADERLGSEVAMVPATPRTVTTCVVGSSRPARTFSADDPVVRSLIQGLNSIPTHPRVYYCAPNRQIEYRTLVRFFYALGPPVTVELYYGCPLQLNNGYLQGTSTDSITQLVASLTWK